MRSVLSIRWLPKISSSSLTSTGLQIATLRRSLTWTTVETWTGICFTVNRKNVRPTTGNSSPNLVQYNISLHCHSQLSNLTIRLYSTTSLESISIKWWLSPDVQTVLLISSTLWIQITWSVILRSDWSVVSQLWNTVNMTKYVTTHRHQSFIFSKSIMDDRWRRPSFKAKL